MGGTITGERSRSACGMFVREDVACPACGASASCDPATDELRDGRIGKCGQSQRTTLCQSRWIPEFDGQSHRERIPWSNCGSTGGCGSDHRVVVVDVRIGTSFCARLPTWASAV